MNCSRCRRQFRVSRPAGPVFLIAHDDQQVREQLRSRLKPLPLQQQFCQSAEEVLACLATAPSKLLLLDVAFAGSFPFELIAAAKAEAAVPHKVVLFPTVYNRTAYKKKPTSLYGADAYLELHHVGDRLLPLLAELAPELRPLVAGLQTQASSGGERPLKEKDLHGRAAEMARLLVADIAVYHQERLSEGVRLGRADQLLARELAEGCRLLQQRLPAAAELAPALIAEEFHQLCRKLAAGRLADPLAAG